MCCIISLHPPIVSCLVIAATPSITASATTSPGAALSAAASLRSPVQSHRKTGESKWGVELVKLVQYETISADLRFHGKNSWLPVSLQIPLRKSPLIRVSHRMVDVSEILPSIEHLTEWRERL